MRSKTKSRKITTRKVRRALNSTNEGPTSITGKMLTKVCWGSGVRKSSYEGKGDYGDYTDFDDYLNNVGDDSEKDFWANRKDEPERITYDYMDDAA